LPGESLGGVDSLLVPKRAKRKNQAWGSNPESRPVAYHIGKSRLTIGPTRLNVVQPRFITPQSPSSLAHTHKGAKTRGVRPAYHWANPAECCAAPLHHTSITKLPSPYSQRCQNLARLRRAFFFFLLVLTCCRKVMFPCSIIWWPSSLGSSSGLYL
jgi:hypothetical protein